MRSVESLADPEAANDRPFVQRVRAYCLADAAWLNTAPTAAERHIAKRMYIVDLLALVELESHDRPRQATQKYRAERLNILYESGLSDAARVYSTATMAPAMRLSEQGWTLYAHMLIYSRVYTPRNENPQNCFDLMVALHKGDAWFTDEPTETQQSG